MPHKNQLIAGLIVTFVLGGLIGWLIGNDRSGHHLPPMAALPIINDRNIRLYNNQYKLIDPLLSSELDSKDISALLYPYEAQITTDLHQEAAQYPNDKISVYYNDLRNLSWAGINEDQDYNPASLIKLPLAIAYYKLAESNPNLMSETITYTGPDQNAKRNIQSPETVPIGQPTTVKDLIKTMLEDSDNNALTALYQNHHDDLSQIFEDLTGEPLPATDQEINALNFISPREFAMYFLVLYNSTYLNANDSEELLEFMSQSAYTAGLKAGVPSNVTVADKFGEREIQNNGILVYDQFNDCGIIYAPGRPYFLCVTTQGQNLNELQGIVREISGIVYSDVSKSVSLWR